MPVVDCRSPGVSDITQRGSIRQRIFARGNDGEASWFHVERNVDAIHKGDGDGVARRCSDDGAE